MEIEHKLSDAWYLRRLASCRVCRAVSRPPAASHAQTRPQIDPEPFSGSIVHTFKSDTKPHTQKKAKNANKITT